MNIFWRCREGHHNFNHWEPCPQCGAPKPPPAKDEPKKNEPAKSSFPGRSIKK